MKKLAIIGAGDLGQLIAYHAINDKHYEVVGFFDDISPLQSVHMGIKVIGKTEDIIALYEKKRFDCLMMGIGYNHISVRKKKFNELKNIIPFGQIIHSSSYIDNSAILGQGVFILPGCTIDKHVVIGDNVLLNTGVIIAHDTIIDAHCFIAPAASIAGKSHIKECCIIGINATVIEKITIEENVKVGAGAVVVDSLSEPGLYVGVPAKKIK